MAFNQTVERKVDPKTFVNTLDPLLGQLRKRPGVVYLKRLTIVLDEDSEKGFGLVRVYRISSVGGPLTTPAALDERECRAVRTL